MSAMQNNILPGLVSTIIPVFNRASLLREAVQSVLDQTYRPIEIIIVDDESTDDTPECIRELISANPETIRSARQKNSGPGAARETGRLMAHGEFIQYLDSDDRLLPEKFARQVLALAEQPEAGVAYCYTRYLRIGEAPYPAPWKGSGRTLSSMFPTFLNERWWDTPTPLYRRSVCDRAGPWTNLRLEEDWEYDCRIAALDTKLVHCLDFLVEVRDHGGERLCRGHALDPKRLKIRSQSQRLILEHAVRAGLNEASPNMQQFSRSLFLLSRQCGAAGLCAESKLLFSLSKRVCGGSKFTRIDYFLYDVLASAIGWNNAGKISCAFDNFRSVRK